MKFDLEPVVVHLHATCPLTAEMDGGNCVIRPGEMTITECDCKAPSSLCGHTGNCRCVIPRDVFRGVRAASRRPSKEES